ncbi:chaplin (plasmid) [Embleya sp. NBC_00888]|uniref:chaplin n=1 Tax=Embleya sp. NBC_00888 TaxID=2975960 RepID=UPI002F91A88A|nr:chaplin [Embleya sp. NBC_00888]
MNTFKKTAAVAVGITALVVSGAGVANAGSEAKGAAVGSPGVLSGNNLQVPIHVPINICGNSLNLLGFFNPTVGNVCANIDGDHDKGGHEGGHAQHQAPQQHGGGHQG